MLRRACQTRHVRPDIPITDRSGIQGTWDGNPGPVAAIPIDRACTGNNRTIVAVTPDRRRLRFGAITSILSGVRAILDISVVTKPIMFFPTGFGHSKTPIRGERRKAAQGSTSPIALLSDLFPS